MLPPWRSCQWYLIIQFTLWMLWTPKLVCNDDGVRLSTQCLQYVQILWTSQTFLIMYKKKRLNLLLQDWISNFNSCLCVNLNVRAVCSWICVHAWVRARKHKTCLLSSLISSCQFSSNSGGNANRKLSEKKKMLQKVFVVAATNFPTDTHTHAHTRTHALTHSQEYTRK